MYFNFVKEDGFRVGFDEDDKLSIEIFMDMFDEPTKTTRLESVVGDYKVVCYASGSTVELLKYKNDILVEHKKTYYTAYRWITVTD